jgi:gliding motility-associated protein GldC
MNSEGIQGIEWEADEAPEPGKQQAKAMILALWDPKTRNSLRIDLWTQDMSIDDMNDFFFQTLLSMADTYKNATNNKDLMAEIKIFAREFAEKASKVAK